MNEMNDFAFYIDGHQALWGSPVLGAVLMLLALLLMIAIFGVAILALGVGQARSPKTLAFLGGLVLADAALVGVAGVNLEFPDLSLSSVQVAVFRAYGDNVTATEVSDVRPSTEGGSQVRVAISDHGFDRTCDIIVASAQMDGRWPAKLLCDGTELPRPAR